MIRISNDIIDNIIDEVYRRNKMDVNFNITNDNDPYDNQIDDKRPKNMKFALKCFINFVSEESEVLLKILSLSLRVHVLKILNYHINSMITL